VNGARHLGKALSVGRVLVIEDDDRIARLVSRALENEGFPTERAATGPTGLSSALAADFDLVVLDLMLPGRSGLEICAELRAHSSVPVIMLTALGEEEDRVVGLELGADDYVTKPFSPRELLARIQAMLRRQAMLGARPAAATAGVARFGEFELNLTTHMLRRNGELVELTSSEFSLLRAFVGNAGRPLSRERLMELAHGRDHDATDRSVDVQVLRLRRLIEPDPSKPRYIKTVWGTGYVFVGDGTT